MVASPFSVLSVVVKTMLSENTTDSTSGGRAFDQLLYSFNVIGYLVTGKIGCDQIREAEYVQ